MPTHTGACPHRQSTVQLCSAALLCQQLVCSVARQHRPAPASVPVCSSLSCAEQQSRRAILVMYTPNLPKLCWPCRIFTLTQTIVASKVGTNRSGWHCVRLCHWLPLGGQTGSIECGVPLGRLGIAAFNSIKASFTTAALLQLGFVQGVQFPFCLVSNPHPFLLQEDSKVVNTGRSSWWAPPLQQKKWY